MVNKFVLSMNTLNASGWNEFQGVWVIVLTQLYLFYSVTKEFYTIFKVSPCFFSLEICSEPTMKLSADRMFCKHPESAWWTIKILTFQCAKYYHNNLCLQFCSERHVGDIKFVLFKLLFCEVSRAGQDEKLSFDKLMISSLQ